ncbi:MAG: hypothetical protein JWR69_3811 [Pedosphaera sp.]|nr:hypothetical protein [Pedosphaera sp.]
MTIYWSLSQIPELSGRSRQQRRIVFRRFGSYMLRTPVNRWSVAPIFAVLLGLFGSAIASNFLSDVPGACVTAVGGFGGFYLQYLISLNYMSRCLRGGDFKVL